jgi:hypothetical protein
MSPGHDELFQDTVIAYLWRNPGKLSVYHDKLESSFFENKTSGTVYFELVQYYKEHKKTPSGIILLDALGRRFPDPENDIHVRTVKTIKEKLSFIVDCDISDSIYIETRLKDFIQLKALEAFAIKTVDDLKNHRYDPELPKRARAALEASYIDEDFGHDWVRQTSSRLYNATSPDHEPRVPTGIKHLDDLIGGGLKAGELGILLGLPKGFKSGSLLNFAFSAMKVYNGLNVLYVTLELDAELVGLRFDFHCAGRTKEQLLADPEKFAKILRLRQDATLGNNRLFIKQFRTKTATCDTLRTYIERLQEHYGIKIGMVIVDYLDLMKATKKREKSYQEDVDICEELRDIAIEYRIPIWTACRATREAVGKKRISMAHMSRAFERVGVADLMIALCQTESEKAENIIRFYLAAARNCEGEKMVLCEVDYARMKLKSQGIMEPEYDEDDKPQRNNPRGKKKDTTDWDRPAIV